MLCEGTCFDKGVGMLPVCISNKNCPTAVGPTNFYQLYLCQTFQKLLNIEDATAHSCVATGYIPSGDVIRTPYRSSSTVMAKTVTGERVLGDSS